MSGPDILKEVEESLRAEKAAKVWKDHGKTFIAIAIALVVGTAAQSLWTSYKTNQDALSTSQFLDSIEAENAITSLGKLGATQKGTGSALAGLTAASLAINDKKWDIAIENYNHVITNKDTPQSFKDLATIQLASLKLDHDTSATADSLLALLAPVLKNKKSEWYTRAVLTSAIIKASKGNNLDGARADLKILKDRTDLPASFQEQVTALDTVYQIRQNEKQNEKKRK